MILINQSHIEIENLLNQFPSDDVARTTITLMSNSTEKYRYDTLDQLQFELLFRKAIVDSARKLSRSGLKFRVFRQSVCNTKYWIRTTDGGFDVRKDVSPSEAINDIFSHGSKYGTECATAILIVYFGALVDTFSKEYFDKHFSNITLMNWRSIHGKLKEIGSVKKSKDFFPGDRRYFNNPDVDPLTPEFQGENVIEMGDSLYYGHPLGVSNANQFIKGLNRKRKKGAEKSAYLMDSVGRPNFKSLSKSYAEDIKS
ncbi:protein-glutamine gamma-glutamyltransferase [Alkalibaculum sp. M08DMB]|uniref:Protein-glutamine gamma-glutamyltransferase n=1 Tax=Alkalibaculum sporogenes TaxID=2655001 RepID=A0A6A7K6X1_9FIRM|nr:protein-glutamine gamma-glutamyltransferase [Alkalibaculum sporogenes]MPW24863.1 protein-glutamine gamma-glutamyltransferase [Alkalibaculum sporogenes]